MTDFRDLLTIKDETDHGGLMGAHRTIDRVPAGDYEMSIQASAFHYCEPRQTIPLHHYERWELAVFGPDDVWMTPESHPEVFRGLAVEDQWEGGAYGVGGFITTQDVQELYDRLVSISAKEPIHD